MQGSEATIQELSHIDKITRPDELLSDNIPSLDSAFSPSPLILTTTYTFLVQICQTPRLLSGSLGFGSRHPLFTILPPLLRSPFVFNVNLRTPALHDLGPLAMVLRCPYSQSAIGLRVSSVWGIGSLPIPRPCFINPITVGRRASYRTPASAPPLTPRIYTFRDLMKKPPRQQTETDKFQRHHEGEKISTQVSPIEETKSKISRTKSQYSIDEKYEVS